MQLSSGLGIKLVVVLFFFGSVVFAQTSSRTSRMSMHSIGMGGVLVDAALTYAQTEGVATPSIGNTWQSNTTLMDVKVGYLGENQWYFGGMYSSRSDSQLSSSTMTGTSSGIGLGKFGAQGFNVRAFYKLNETFGNYRNGSGFQIDVGWLVNIAASFYLGVDFSYRDITFKDNPSIANYQAWTRREIYPFITMGFLVF